MSDTLTRQTTDHMKAEIAFRQKLARQHVTGEMLLPDYYGKDEHDRILAERIEETRRTMRRLADAGTTLSPFLELGAERGQRSLVLTNDFGEIGIAADISFHQLRTMEHFAEVFKLPQLPLRVCCDANNLPFHSGAFPFIFAYQFLHHFPSPVPVVNEIHRVMASGSFYFAEEPYPRMLRLALYRQGNKAYSEKGRARNRYLRFLESFISVEHCEETDHGVIENDEISLETWRDSLSVFDRCDAELLSPYGVRSPLRARRSVRHFANRLLGGLVSGLCTKRGEPARRVSEIDAVLACPECASAADLETDRSGLVKVDASYECPRCGSAYPIRDGVVFLMRRQLLAELYPEVVAA